MGFLQSAHAAGVAANAATASFGSNTTTGSAILVVVAANNNSANRISSVTDNKGNTYTRVQSFHQGVNDLEIWQSLNITGGAGHTVTGTSSGVADNVVIIAQEFLGLLTSLALDKNTATGTTGTTADSGNTATTTQADELIFGGMAEETNATISLGSGFSNLDSDLTIASLGLGAESKIVSATGAYNATFGLGSSVNWLAAVATFKLASSGPTAANDVSMWGHPTNQPRPRKKSLLEISGGAASSATTTQQNITAKANIIGAASANPEFWIQDTQQPLRNRVPKRQQVNRVGRNQFLVTSTVTNTITAKANIIALVTTDVAAWIQETQQPLRNRTPKRQQLPRTQRGQFLVTSTFTRTITAVANIIGLPATDASSWNHTTNQPLRNRIPKRQQLPRPDIFSAPITVVNTITAKANITGAVYGWRQPVNQPLRNRISKRLQPARSPIFVLTTTGSRSITAKANIIVTPAVDVEFYKQPTNQPLRNRVPKRQQLPRTQRDQFLVTITVTNTITAKANITGLATVDVELWKQPVNQPLRNRVPKRQQLPRTQKGQFLVTVTTTNTITAKANITGFTSANPTSWIQETNQPLRSRIPKRQQPGRVPNFILTIVVSRTITAKANIIGYASINPETWIQDTQQPLRNRIPKRQQPIYRHVFTLVTTSTHNITAQASIRGTVGHIITAVARIYKPPVALPSQWINIFAQIANYNPTVALPADWQQIGSPGAGFGTPAVPSAGNWQITPPSNADWRQ